MIQIPLIKVGRKCILDTDRNRIQGEAVSSVSLGTVSKILPNPEFQKTETNRSAGGTGLSGSHHDDDEEEEEHLVLPHVQLARVLDRSISEFVQKLFCMYRAGRQVIR